MKIGFFFENGMRDEGRDLRNIDLYNPGIAGTPYMFYLIAHLIAARDNGIDVTFFVKKRMVFSDKIHMECVTSLSDALNMCDRQHINYLIVKHYDGYWDMIRKSNTKVIVWCHNFVSFRRLRDYAKCDSIARLVCVGREQADIYRDHRAFKKTDWIYNGVDNSLFRIDNDSLTPNSLREHIVTYVGAVIPGKGFHILAKAWPSILEKIPDAQLFVIGNGKLYGGNFQLGKFGLAEKQYENRFMKYLTNESGNLLPSIHLMGIMGKEKFDILAKTKVGVPNPSGLTETFCNSGVEMQLMGAIIASRRCTGYMDTVKNGKLIDNPTHLASCVVECLLSSENRYAETYQAIKNKFSPDRVVVQWEKLLIEAIPQNKRLNPLSPLTNPNFELKRWKEALRKIKEQHTWLYYLPSLGFFTESWKAVKWAVWKHTILK